MYHFLEFACGAFELKGYKSITQFHTYMTHVPHRTASSYLGTGGNVLTFHIACVSQDQIEKGSVAFKL